VLLSVASEKSLRSARKAKGAGHLRRGEILLAAERIFVRDGYHGATIRKIAQEVGLSSTALYMHFRDKGEILAAICESALAQLIVQNEELALQPMEPVTRLRRMMEAYIRWGLANPNTYQLVFASPPGALSEEKLGELGALSGKSYEPFAESMRAVAASGRLRGGVAVSIEVCWVSTHGLISLLINQAHYQWTGTPESLQRTLLDTLFRGLLTD
jgi:AcrR family transcriptional regulator